MSTRLLAPLFVVLSVLAGCSTSTTERLKLPPLKTVPYVDLEKYLGTWYEIARYDQSFQEGCVASTATYTLEEDGDIGVLNQCRKETVDGELEAAEGTAKIVDKQTNSKLKVTFFWPFYGDYWIIDLADDYSWVVVSAPSRDYLWILSRTPTMDDALYNKLLDDLERRGFDRKRLIKPPQRLNQSLP